MINVGIVGTGSISNKFVESAEMLEHVEVGGVLSRDLEKARAFSQKYGLKAYFDDYQDMLKSDRIDTIYVALPNSLHFEYGMQAVAAGKRVILEKPFVSNLSELTRLYQAAEQSNVQLFELDRVIGSPNYLAIQDALEKIQPVRVVSINYSQYSRRYDAFLSGKMQNVFSDEFSGGALVDLGVYSIHLVTGLFGAPQQITYVAEQLPNTIDVSGSLTLKYDGMFASLIQSKNTKCNNRITIQGEKGTIYAYPAPSKIDKVELDTTTLTDITAASNLDGATARLKEIARIVTEKDQDAYRENLKHIQIVMETMVQARKVAGIVFTADKGTA